MDIKANASSDERTRNLDTVRTRSLELNQSAFAEQLRGRQLCHFGLPVAGWIMLIIEIIPTFVYFALSLFHMSYHNFQKTRVDDEQLHFYAIIASVPTVFLISVLSDGYVYGKFISEVIVLFLASLAGACSILISLNDFASETVHSVMMRISVFSVYFYFIALPIQLTIFADLVTHNKNHPNARKCFTLFWVCNLLGAALGLKIFKHYFDMGDPEIISALTIALVALTMIYFLGACIIVCTLPLQLQTTNLFIYHMKCFCFAIRQQPSLKNWDPRKPGVWLEGASKKFTLTEVKRTKSIYFLSLYIIPFACYFDCQSSVYFYWYSTRFVLSFGGAFVDDYSFFYLHMVITSVISLIIQFAVLPILSKVFRNIRESWILFTGFLFLGLSLILQLQAEIVCHNRHPAQYFKSNEVSLVRLINGYPHDIIVKSEWIKKSVLIRPGNVFLIKVEERNVQTFGETAVFQMPQFKMVDLIATTVKQNEIKNYLMKEGGCEEITVEGTEIRKRTKDKLRESYRRFNSTILILCSPELKNRDLTMSCYYVHKDRSVMLPTVKICRTRVDYRTGSAVVRTIPTVMHYYPRQYKCRTSDGQLHILDVEPKVFYLLYYMNSSILTTEDEFLKREDKDSSGSIFVKTDLTFEACSMAQSLLLLQIVMHAISTSCMLICINTIVCLYGPPRLRMISFAVLCVGIFTGMIIIRLTILSNLEMLNLCLVHAAIYILGFFFLLYNVLFIKFELHSWEQPWRPSIFYKLFLCIRNRVLYKRFLSEKGPRYVSNEKIEKSILQSDVDKDRRSEDDRGSKKVTFNQIEVDPSIFEKADAESNNDDVTDSESLVVDKSNDPQPPQRTSPQPPQRTSPQPQPTTSWKPPKSAKKKRYPRKYE